MIKYILSFTLILTFIIPVSTNAQSAVARKVWFTPVPGKEVVTLNVGDPILVYAKLNNVLQEPVVYVLAFTTTEKTIGTKVVTVPGYTGQDVSIEWSMPQESTVVTATIARATDKDKKELKALAGPVGTVIVGTEVATPDIGPIKGWVGGIVTALETFRTKQFEHFTIRKEEAKEVLSRTTIKDVGDLLQPQPIEESPADAAPQVEKKDNGTTVGYLKLMYATAGKAFFAHKAVYFVAIILIGLLIVRFILKLLFR